MALFVSHSALSRIGGLSPGRAGLVAVALIGLMAGCFYVALRGPLSPPARLGEGDAALYRAITERVHAGEGYYSAAGAELRRRHYGVRSVFNWRLPGMTVVIAALPSPGYAKGILVGGAGVAIFLAVNLLRRQAGGAAAAVGGILLVGAMMGAAVGDTFLFSELWAGVLILLSMMCYAREKRLAGALLAVGALFARELGAIYVLVCVGMAIGRWRRGWVKEIGILGAGVVIYGGYFLWHVGQVKAHLTAGDPAYPTGWIQFGMLRFVLSTVRENAWLMVLPDWVTAVYLPVALLGVLGWRGAPAGRIAATVAAYLGLFAVAGKPFNDYWGLMTAPLLAVEFAWGLVCAADLGRAIYTRTSLVTRPSKSHSTQ